MSRSLAMAPCRSPDAAHAMPLAVPATVPGGIRGAWHGTRVRCRHPGFRPATSAPVQPSAGGLHPGYLGTALSPITKIARASLGPPFCRFVSFMFPESTAITRPGSENLTSGSTAEFILRGWPPVVPKSDSARQPGADVPLHGLTLPPGVEGHTNPRDRFEPARLAECG